MDNSEIAYAKINLALHILGRRDDGYHDIDTIFAFMNDGDRLCVKDSADIERGSVELDIIGPFAADIDCDSGDNLIVKTAHKLREHHNIKRGAHIILTKNLPVASGIGGGSADAAAAARLLNRHWGLGQSLAQLVAQVGGLGADIAACIYSQTCRGEGIGSHIAFLDDLPLQHIPILLVNPRVSVSTGPIFAAWDKDSSGAISPINLHAIANQHDNDMQRAAITLFPQIAEVLDVLKQDNPLLCRMSGSGATCFALYETLAQRDAAQAYIEQHHGNWWCMSGQLK